MSAPASLARVLAALKRLSPSWPSTATSTRVGKELGSIAVAIAMAADALDAALDEVFPDTTTQLIDRWEKVCRIATRSADPIATRRLRVLSVLRRSSGPRLDQLGAMLTGVLGVSIDDMIFVEQLRSNIEEGVVEKTGVVAIAVPTAVPGATISFEKPRPGVVDDAGVQVYIAMSSFGTTVATLTSPNGTVWTIPVTATGWYNTRSVFTGKVARGIWTFNIRDSGAPTLTECRLLISNSIDSAQIYNFYVLRDPALPGTADLVEAQRLFQRTALGEMRAFVVETLAFTHGDSHSRHGRDPIGA